jgi:hypothetical protein
LRALVRGDISRFVIIGQCVGAVSAHDRPLVADADPILAAVVLCIAAFDAGAASLEFPPTFSARIRRARCSGALMGSRRSAPRTLIGAFKVFRLFASVNQQCSNGAGEAEHQNAASREGD